jgi:tetratricopeptide (TPR) repeat protein
MTKIMINIVMWAILLTSPVCISAFDASYDAFQTANNLARLADYPKAITNYRNMAAMGQESGSLYWNWAQAALAQGRSGEALWAYLRAMELEPNDRAIAREIERLREAINLDSAELTPDPLAVLARNTRRFRFDILSSLLLTISVLTHLIARLRKTVILARVSGVTFMVGALLTTLIFVGALADPTGVVVRRGASLVDAASQSADTLGALREGEVVPILQESGSYLLVEDASGARGWTHIEDVRRLDRPLKIP